MIIIQQTINWFDLEQLLPITDDDRQFMIAGEDKKILCSCADVRLEKHFHEVGGKRWWKFEDVRYWAYLPTRIS